jgi:zinc protease
MKFETIDQFTEKGLELFADMIMNPLFDSVDVENIRKFLFGQLGRNSGSTYKTARNKFYAALFENSAYAKTIQGSYRTVGSITVEDLKNHHQKMYSPENMIITIGTNYPVKDIMAMAKEKFGAMSKTGFTPIEPEQPSEFSRVKKAHEKMEKEQVYIYIGHMLPSAASDDAAAIKVANAILSKRLQMNLREKQSLAYSVGSSVALDKNFGWFVASIGTGVDNFDKAHDGILAEIENLKTAPPDIEELEEAVNSMWGSNLMRKLSRINQAYYMGVYEYLGLGYDYDDKQIEKIRNVTAEQVQQAAQKYFDTKNYVLATAGNI